jgi:hypothetical protein
MPAKYDGVVGFIVTGVDHTISANRWVTNLKAQTIILQGGGKTADKDYPKEEDKDPSNKGFNTQAIFLPNTIKASVKFCMRYILCRNTPFYWFRGHPVQEKRRQSQG